MKIVDLSIKRPILMTMVILSFVVIGLFSLTRLGIDITPKVDLPYVVVTVPYPGAGPEEIETLITEPVEEEISAIGGIKNVTSFSQEGMSITFAEFELGVDVDIAAIDVKDKVDQIKHNLPEDILDPVIQKFDIGALPIIDLAVSSTRPLDETYRIADDIVKKGISRVRGVAGIRLTGGLEREIQVNLSRRRLKAYGLSPQMVIARIASENLNIPAGSVITGRREVSVRMAGEFTDLREIERIEIPLKEGRTVRLEDIGWVEDTFKEQRERAAFNGESSVGVALIKRADANTVATANEVFREMERIRHELPPDVKLEVARDRSQFIKDSVDDVFGNMIVGVLLTAFVLFLFLHNIPVTVIAAVAMPTSIIATFILIDFAGFTLNMMSLMGLAISVGILVANSIVVLENIQRFQQMGKSTAEAASQGTHEIALAVTASTLTNIVVFTPMAFMSGIVGQFFKQFGLTVAFATLFSLLVSFTLTPMLAAHRIRKGFYIALGGLTGAVIWWRLGTDPFLGFLLAGGLGLLAWSYGLLSRFQVGWDRFYDGIVEDYRRSLAWTLRHKTLVLAVVVLLLIGSVSLLGFGFIGSEFFPKSDQGSFSVSVEMPVGSSLDETDRTVVEVGRRLMGLPYVRSVYVASGRSESGFRASEEVNNLGMAVVRLVDADLRPITTAELMDQARARLTDLPGAQLTLREVSMFGGGGEADLQVEITGRDIDELNLLADSLMQYMRDVGGIVNIESSWELGKPELKMTPKRDVLADQEFSTAAVGMTLRALVEGEVASKYRDAGDEYDIRVQLDPADLRRPEDLGDVYIKVGDRQMLVRELVDLKDDMGPTTIYRKNKQRMVMVTGDVSTGTLGEKVGALRSRLQELTLSPGYKVHFGGQAERMGEAFSELLRALVLAIILTYMLLAAILESYKHPFIIMLTLPLGLIGVLLSLFLTDNTISIFSLMAVVMLVGIVVNNGILLIDYINQLRGQGKGVDDAIVEACPVRLRPIIMTNVATALGMLPLALGLGAGGEFRSPMAIVSIGGLLTSALFTLYVIPVIYRLLEGRAR